MWLSIVSFLGTYCTTTAETCSSPTAELYPTAGNNRSQAGIPFAPVLPTEEVSEHVHEIKVKISKKISETAAVLHGRIPESYVIYLDNCAALIQKKDLAMQHKGW